MPRVAPGAVPNCTVSDVFLDTNILVYGFDGSEPVKQRAVWNLLESTDRFVVSTQVLLEFYVVLTRKLSPSVSVTDARTGVETLSALPVVAADSTLVRRAVETSITDRIPVWDAMIIEAAVEGGCSQVWTEDLADRTTIRGVQIVNPLADTNAPGRS